MGTSYFCPFPSQHEKSSVMRGFTALLDTQRAGRGSWAQLIPTHSVQKPPKTLISITLILKFSSIISVTSTQNLCQRYVTSPLCYADRATNVQKLKSKAFLGKRSECHRRWGTERDGTGGKQGACRTRGHLLKEKNPMTSPLGASCDAERTKCPRRLIRNPSGKAPWLSQLNREGATGPAVCQRLLSATTEHRGVRKERR